MMGGNIQKKKMVDDSGDNTAAFVAYKMPPTANPTTIRQHVSGNQANNFDQPFTTAEERKRSNTTDEYITIIRTLLVLYVPVLTMNTPRTHIPIAKGTATLGKFGSAMGM